KLGQLDGLVKQVSPFDSFMEMEEMMTNHAAYALLVFEQKPYEMKAVLQELRKLIPHNEHIFVQVTGKSVVQADVNRASQQDLQKAELIGIPVAFVILWLAFGGIVSAFIPIVIGLVGVTRSMGVMYWIGTGVDLSNFVLNVIPMVGLALSID